MTSNQSSNRHSPKTKQFMIAWYYSSNRGIVYCSRDLVPPIKNESIDQAIHFFIVYWSRDFILPIGIRIGEREYTSDYDVNQPYKMSNQWSYATSNWPCLKKKEARNWIDLKNTYMKISLRLPKILHIWLVSYTIKLPFFLKFHLLEDFEASLLYLIEF